MWYPTILFYHFLPLRTCATAHKEGVQLSMMAIGRFERYCHIVERYYHIVFDDPTTNDMIVAKMQTNSPTVSII
jgi:hypothetical protein